MPTPVGPCGWDLPPAASAPAGQDVIFAGADLEPSTLIAAYSTGLFPMKVLDGDTDEYVLGWWSPDPRGIIELDSLRVSRSLARSIDRFTISMDHCFETVMRACGDPKRPDGWITEEFISAYVRLHELGWAHSIEVRNSQGQLVGGLYGVSIGGLFAGESMFHYETDASKVALVALVEFLRTAGDAATRILDVQWASEHLKSLGAIELSREKYLARLPAALSLPDPFECAYGKRTT